MNPRRIILGVTGGIAAYKAVSLLRLLTEAGHDTQVVATQSALKFVGSATWQALSGKPVHTGVFDTPSQVEHIALGQSADMIIVAPATADFLARYVAGRSEDLLGAVLLSATCPVLVAPAMHTQMWNHPATAANTRILRQRGVIFLGPAKGRLTGSDSGVGRMLEAPEIFALASEQLARIPAHPDLEGRRVLITAGGTREVIDPVRFIGNRSTGTQGIALARAARSRGAQVTLLAANIEQSALDTLVGVRVVRADTTEQMERELRTHAPGADTVIMAAAIADWTPLHTADSKLKKGASDRMSLELVKTPDLLAGLVRERREGQYIVGFAAETGDDGASALEHARRKAVAKGCDLLCFNQVGQTTGFGEVENDVVFLDSDGNQTASIRASKINIAHAIFDIVRNASRRD